MSDDMDENSPDSLLGSIIKALILVAIWPYLSVLLGIFIAYLLGLLAFAWIEKKLAIHLRIFSWSFSDLLRLSMPSYC